MGVRLESRLGEIEEERDMVSKREVVPEDERSSESCLHCEINDLVQEYVEGQEGAILPTWQHELPKALSILFSLLPRRSKRDCSPSASRTLDTHSSKRVGRSKGIRVRRIDVAWQRNPSPCLISFGGIWATFSSEPTRHPRAPGGST